MFVVRALLCFILFVFSPSYQQQRGGGGEGGDLPDFLSMFSSSCLAEHQRAWPPCKIVFWVGNQYAECDNNRTATKKGSPHLRHNTADMRHTNNATRTSAYHMELMKNSNRDERTVDSIL